MMITKLTGILLITCTLVGSYPQKLLINSGKLNETSFQVVEKNEKIDIKNLKKNIKIPQLTGGKNKNNIENINKKIQEDIYPKVEDAEKTSQEYFLDSDNNIGMKYEVKSNYFITKNDEKILSIYMDYYEFLGGAHGNTIRTSYTIDKSKEIILRLKDLFVEGYDYKSIINREIFKIIENNKEDYFDGGSVFKGVNDDTSFYIEGNDLIIYYQLYELAPYVFGIPQFKIDMSLFDDNYRFKSIP